MKQHRTDGVSLGFGMVFLLVAVWWAVSQVVNVALPMLGWVLAGVLILFGVVGLLGAIRPRRAEVRQPVRAEAVVETPGDLPEQLLHAEIVQELLDDAATRFTREHPGAPAASATQKAAPEKSATENTATGKSPAGKPAERAVGNAPDEASGPPRRD